VTLYQSDSSLPEDAEQEKQGSGNSNAQLERQKQEAQQTLDQISALKNVILTESPQASIKKTTNTDEGESSFEDYQRQVEELEAQVSKIELDLVPPRGLSMDEYKTAMVLFLQSPCSVRVAICQALELESPNKAATDLQRLPEIVALMYQQRIQLTPQKLQDALKKVQTNRKLSAFTGQNVQVTILPDGTVETSNVGTSQSSSSSESSDEAKEGFDWNNLLFDESEGKTQEELRLENVVKNVLGRVTRKEGIEATKDDLDRMVKVLDKSTFVVSGTQKIPGGYIIRGKRSSKIKTTGELIQAIDAKLPEDYPAQVSLMVDVTNADFAAGDEDPVLVLLNKDLSPGVSFVLTTICSTVAVVSAFVYCVSVYGGNDLVTSRLSEATAINDADGLSWFTDKVYFAMVPMFGIQLLHEVGHFIAAKSNKMELGAPTLLPFWSLPFMGAKTDLLTSPPNRNALFDVGVAGPLTGLLASLACLAWGLDLTATADASAMQYFPSLPVSLLQTSSLGGTMVDFFLGGGAVGAENRFITMQDPATLVTVHPLVVASFISLLLNAIALLPLGSTDGGRMSLAIFGRFGHTLVGAVAWVAILVAAFGMEQGEVLLGAWLVNNVVQNDMEIPCRDEIEEVSIPRLLAAVSIWFVTVLAVTPL